MSDDYLWDGSGDPEPATRDLERTLSVLRYDRDWTPTVQRAPRRAAAAAGVVLALAAGVAIGFGVGRLPAPPGPQATAEEPVSGEAREALPSGAAAAGASVLDPWTGRSLPPVAPSAVIDPFDAVLTPGEAASVVRKHGPALRAACWEPLLSQGLTSGPAKLTLELTVAPDGRVTSALTRGDTSPDLVLGRCVAREARAWPFPKPSSTTKLSVPIVFSASPPPSASSGILDPWDAPPAATSKLGSDQIQQVVSSKAAELKRSCWTRALEARPADAPDVARTSLRLVIAPSGVVTESRAVDPPGYSGLGSCIAARARAWVFPAANASSTVNVPFVFAVQ